MNCNMAKKNKEVKNKIKKVIKKWNEAAEIIGTLDVVIKGVKYDLDIFDTLRVRNTQNYEEVLTKMARAASIFWSLGSMKTDIEEELSTLELEYEIWLESHKGNYNDEKSEGGRKRQVIIKLPKSYREKNMEIIVTKKVLGRVSRAKNSVEKMCFMLQSIGAMLRDEKTTSYMGSK